MKKKEGSFEFTKVYYEVQEYDDAEGLGEIAFCCSPTSLKEAEREYALCDKSKYRRLIVTDADGILERIIQADYGKED